jgi:hypothetical protein
MTGAHPPAVGRTPCAAPRQHRSRRDSAPGPTT